MTEKDVISVLATFGALLFLVQVVKLLLLLIQRVAGGRRLIYYPPLEKRAETWVTVP